MSQIYHETGIFVGLPCILDKNITQKDILDYIFWKFFLNIYLNHLLIFVFLDLENLKEISFV